MPSSQLLKEVNQTASRKHSRFSVMPRASRALSSKTAPRATPYTIPAVHTSSSHVSNMAIAVSAPGMWDSMGQHAQYYHMDAQMQGQVDSYNQHLMSYPHTGLPTPMSSAGPVRPLSAPMPVPLYQPPANKRYSGPWTDTMDGILERFVKTQKWDQISRLHFNGEKSGNACRKRYARMQRERKQPSKWPEEDKKRILDVYNTQRQEIWQQLAERFDRSWEDIEELVSIGSVLWYYGD